MGKSAWEVDDDYQHEKLLLKQRAAACHVLEAFAEEEFRTGLDTLEVPQRFRDSLEDLRNWIHVQHIDNGN